MFHFCEPSEWLSESDLSELARFMRDFGAKESDWRPVWHASNLDEVAAAFTAWMQTLPLDQQAVIPGRIFDMVNGETRRRKIGFGAYNALFHGTDECRCCKGWRLLLLLIALPAIGFVLGRASVLW